jgi:hypothetical protein
VAKAEYAGSNKLSLARHFWEMLKWRANSSVVNGSFDLSLAVILSNGYSPAMT